MPVSRALFLMNLKVRTISKPRAKYPVIISQTGWEKQSIITSDNVSVAPASPPPFATAVVKIDTKLASVHTSGSLNSASSVEDEEFEKATLKYLQSPTAQSILQMPSAPAPVLHKRESDTVSNASSILCQSSWPVPPPSPLDALHPFRGTSRNAKSVRHESADTLDSMRFALPPPVPSLLTSSDLALVGSDSTANEELAFSEVNAVPIPSIPAMPKVVRKDSRRAMGLGPGAHRGMLSQKRSDGAIYLTVVKETTV
jgi:hypothetical protein